MFSYSSYPIVGKGCVARQLGVQTPTGPQSAQAMWGQRVALVVRVEVVTRVINTKKRNTPDQC